MRSLLQRSAFNHDLDVYHSEGSAKGLTITALRDPAAVQVPHLARMQTGTFETPGNVVLGQIVAYQAALGASTVIWIAASFKEPYLSAIRWLNAAGPPPSASTSTITTLAIPILPVPLSALCKTA